eukprot:scaffold51_cov401-Prasinococcus_capsulatus_cf.AAC.17
MDLVRVVVYAILDVLGHSFGITGALTSTNDFSPGARHRVRISTDERAATRSALVGRGGGGAVYLVQEGVLYFTAEYQNRGKALLSHELPEGIIDRILHVHARKVARLVVVFHDLLRLQELKAQPTRLTGSG